MTEIRTKSLQVRAKASSAPTPEQLAAINTHTLRPFTAEEIVVRGYVVAHNAIDRDRECFAPALLEDFARSYPGKGVFDSSHPTGWNGTGGPAEGKIFASRTERMPHDAARLQLKDARLLFPADQPDAVLLHVDAYFVKTPANEAFLLKTEAGIGADVSIGFNAAAPERLKDANGIELNVWRWNAPGEALELSHVWLGAQPGARAIKSASREESAMDKQQQEQQVAALTAERDQHKAAADANAAAAKSIKALREAFGEKRAALLDAPAALVALLDDAEAHRKALVDALVTFDRQAAICGDTPEAVAEHAKLFASMPTAHLQALVTRNEKTAGAKGGGFKPSDPSASATGQRTKDAPADSPVGNPLIGYAG